MHELRLVDSGDFWHVVVSALAFLLLELDDMTGPRSMRPVKWVMYPATMLEQLAFDSR